MNTQQLTRHLKLLGFTIISENDIRPIVPPTEAEMVWPDRCEKEFLPDGISLDDARAAVLLCI